MASSPAGTSDKVSFAHKLIDIYRFRARLFLLLSPPLNSTQSIALPSLLYALVKNTREAISHSTSTITQRPLADFPLLLFTNDE